MSKKFDAAQGVNPLKFYNYFEIPWKYGTILFI